MLDATDDIREVNDRGVHTLVSALRWGGAAFNNTGWNPRPIEGSGHTFFYSLEHLIHRPFLHGQIVGLGLLLWYTIATETEITDAWLDEGQGWLTGSAAS
ncbi:MAG: hypothetical protein WCK58_17075 [Chloroflexota bacterium]